MKTFKLILLLFFTSIFMSGCLICEKKEYTFEITNKTSGKLTIIFHNIMSMKENGKDMSEKDFTLLTSEYVDGNLMKENYPNAKVRNFRLFEKDGVLNGKLTIYFEKIDDARLYQHMGKGPYMLHLDVFSEVYDSSNGTYGGVNMPVVFWEKNIKELKLVTKITEPSEETVSLLGMYKKWKK